LKTARIQMMKTDEIKRIIERAFPSNHILARSDKIELRSKLVALRESDLIELLGPVLIGTVENNATNSPGPDWVDSVVRFLAGPNLPHVDSGITDLKTAEMQLNAYANESRSEALKLFETFSREQGHAILSWLKLAQSWTQSNLDPSELDAAISYWSNRVCPE
jgi:hypothetical protein